ncbi:MAG TPA: hypothetical protein VEI97_16200 [bacterium]|nr:hypothetical protein [bacterium]
MEPKDPKVGLRARALDATMAERWRQMEELSARIPRTWEDSEYLRLRKEWSDAEEALWRLCCDHPELWPLLS